MRNPRVPKCQHLMIAQIVNTGVAHAVVNSANPAQKGRRFAPQLSIAMKKMTCSPVCQSHPGKAILKYLVAVKCWVRRDFRLLYFREQQQIDDVHDTQQSAGKH